MKIPFQRTRWSLVSATKDPATAAKALEELCSLYWYPVYAFIRRSGWPPEDAKDCTQEFFVRILARGDFVKADPALGKLRSYLLGAVRHHMAKELEKTRALKRGGGAVFQSIEEAQAEERYALEPVDEVTPVTLYERRWALTILENAVQALRASYERRDRLDEFLVLRPFLSWNSGEDYASAAAALKRSPGAVNVAVFRLRQRFRDALIEQISHTLSDESEIQEELRFLCEVVSRGV
ncbi:MAG: RNA polymerase subunit sigma-24 [Verrucomicrobia bacterium]|nr:RNA polymerase subunit sigma-24 [Verrucomicrobiota bacterium]